MPVILLVDAVGGFLSISKKCSWQCHEKKFYRKHLYFSNFYFCQWGFCSVLLNGTTTSMPVIIVGKLRHWNYYVFKICHGFRIACETRFSLTWGSAFPCRISLNNDIFASSSLYCFSFLISGISDVKLNSNVQSQNIEVYQGLLYELEL